MEIKYKHKHNKRMSVDTEIAKHIIERDIAEDLSKVTLKLSVK